MRIQLPAASLFRWLAVAALVVAARLAGAAQAADAAAGTPLSFQNEGATLAGVFYAAPTEKPAATVVLVQGYPGREGDFFGLGPFLQKEGINVFAFNYRGSWKSEGRFSVENAIADVVKAVAFLSQPEVAERCHVDRNRIVLVGYSFGAGMVLLGAKSCPGVERIVSIATTNLRVTSAHIDAVPAYRARHLEAMEKAAAAGIIRGTMTGAEFHAWLSAHQAEFDLAPAIDALAGRKILLIAGWNDGMIPIEEHALPLYRRLQKADPTRCRLVLLETDHSFRNVLPELQRSVLDWVRQ